MSPYSGFLFKIMRQVKIIFRGLAVFGEFSKINKYEMLVKLKHIACWIEIPSFWLQALHSPKTYEMVWTKDEVDKYVVQVERNCKSAHEVS